MNQAPPRTTSNQNTKVMSNARPFVLVSLVLAVALIAGVLIGSKVYFNRVALSPVSMPELPSPMADSPECASFVGSLPKSLLGHSRADLAAPAPAGAAAWQSSSTQRITLRCGVDMPLQFTSYTPIESVNGAGWMRLDDPVPGSSLTTWYTTDRLPAVAITVNYDDHGAPVNPANELEVASLPTADLEPAPAPLSNLENSGSDEALTASRCLSFLDTLPETVAEGYNKIDVPEDLTAAWSAPGAEPIVVRCGVKEPENYQAGTQLNQINGVPWFEDTAQSSGTGATTWFALGRVEVVAAYLPLANGNEAATNLTNAIISSVAEQS